MFLGFKRLYLRPNASSVLTEQREVLRECAFEGKFDRSGRLNAISPRRNGFKLCEQYQCSPEQTVDEGGGEEENGGWAAEERRPTWWH